MGLTMKEKQAVAMQVRSRCLQAGRKEKSSILNGFIKITRCKNRKYALHILNKRQPPQDSLIVKVKAAKFEPPQKRPFNRTGKKSIPMSPSLLSASSGSSSGIKRSNQRFAISGSSYAAVDGLYRSMAGLRRYSGHPHCLIKNLTDTNSTDGRIRGFYGIYDERKAGGDQGICSPVPTSAKPERKKRDSGRVSWLTGCHRKYALTS
ncbi:MAG: hypothetical protein LBL45_11755 [Treponema sp.]|nr:hypothetical protein [Treponema sp.]